MKAQGHLKGPGLDLGALGSSGHSSGQEEFWEPLIQYLLEVFKVVMKFFFYALGI